MIHRCRRRRRGASIVKERVCLRAAISREGAGGRREDLVDLAGGELVANALCFGKGDSNAAPSPLIHIWGRLTRKPGLAAMLPILLLLPLIPLQEPLLFISPAHTDSLGLVRARPCADNEKPECQPAAAIPYSPTKKNK